MAAKHQCPLCKQIIEATCEEDCIAHMSTCGQFEKQHGSDARAARAEKSRSAAPAEKTTAQNDEEKSANADGPAEQKCAACGSASSSVVLRCGGCKAMYYCNRACQTAHWKSHKHLCKALSHKAAVAPLDVSSSVLKAREGPIRNSKDDFKATIKHEMGLFCKYPESVQTKIFEENAKVRDDPDYKCRSDAEVQMLFTAADADSDGALNSKEWFDFVEKMMLWEESKFGQAPRTSPEEVQKRFEAYDVDGVGKVTYVNYQQREQEKEDLGSEVAAEFMESLKDTPASADTTASLSADASDVY